MMRTTDQKVINFIQENKLIDARDKVLVAFSGGPDSVFLLEFLLKYKRKFKITIAAFHMNHNLRGKEADKDERFCKEYITKKNIVYFASSKNVRLYSKKNKLSLEEAGRKLRYNELLKIAGKNNYTKIATAHNLDDNTETVFLNLIKGTGLKGLSGIPIRREKIIRPILAISKQEILGYLQKKKLEYRIDDSNLKSDYRRNYLRNKIIPIISKKLNPQLNTAVFRNAEIVRDFSSFVEDQTMIAIQNIVIYKSRKLIFNLNNLNDYDPRLYGNIFREAVIKYFNIELENKNVHDLKTLVNKQTGRQIGFSNGVTAIKERHSIIIYKKGREKTDNSIKLKINDKTYYRGKIIRVSEVINNKLKFDSSGVSEFISADKIKGDLIIRKWTNGDRFFPLGMNNSKKVSDFLNEQKVDSLIKKEQLVVTNYGNIIWVVGLRIDNRYKITDNTISKLKLSVNK